MDKYRARKLN